MQTSSENGLHLPPDLKLYAWNQLAVESGYVHDCVLKRTALQSWEDEFNNMSAAPVPLYDGDGLFPPKLSVHPNWVYNTGRVQTPWSDVLEPEGLKPPSHGTGADQDRDSASMPKATPSHGPKHNLLLLLNLKMSQHARCGWKFQFLKVRWGTISCSSNLMAHFVGQFC